MGDELIKSIFTVLTALVGVAIISVLVSKNANTSTVIQAGAAGFAQDLQAATGPVTGNNSGGLSSFGGFSGGAGFPNTSL